MTILTGANRDTITVPKAAYVSSFRNSFSVQFNVVPKFNAVPQFNATSSSSEHMGRASPDTQAMDDFNLAIRDCHVVAIPYTRGCFIWMGLDYGDQIKGSSSTCLQRAEDIQDAVVDFFWVLLHSEECSQYSSD
ncbi:hypothetical protein ACH5RR_025764 [Cinchona calisaya]|uniref:Uncharacterized protein n=1 Tax=Cinchona calisaya TaxID=153742 RepID=A0ABD2Z4K7_9GENT